jgi:preprotein translocase subunit SecG
MDDAARARIDQAPIGKRPVIPDTPSANVKTPLYKAKSDLHSPAPMILAAIDWLSISINLLLVVFVIICLLMTLLILMQRPKQEGLGAAFGAGVTDQVFGARTTNVLQRGTVYLGSAFFILSLALAILIGQKNKKQSLLSDSAPPAAVTAPAAPVEPAAPKSLLDELPAEPAAPAETPTAPPVEAPLETPAPELETPAPEAPSSEAQPTAPTPSEVPADAAAPAPAETPAEKTEGQ